MEKEALFQGIEGIVTREQRYLVERSKTQWNINVLEVLQDKGVPFVLVCNTIRNKHLPDIKGEIWEVVVAQRDRVALDGVSFAVCADDKRVAVREIDPHERATLRKLLPTMHKAVDAHFGRVYEPKNLNFKSHLNESPPVPLLKGRGIKKPKP
jgi:hypothetical protein